MMKKTMISRIAITILASLGALCFFYIDNKEGTTEQPTLWNHASPWFELAEAALMVFPITILIYMLFGHAEHARKMKLRMKKLDLVRTETEQFLILGRLAASIAHEVRNPLNNIFLILDELQRVSTAESQAQGLSTRIKRNAQRINHAVELVYRLARPIDIQNNTEADEFADIIALFDSMVHEFAEQGARIMVYNRTNKKCVFMSGDYDCLQTIFENLLRNAVLAAPDTAVSVDIEDSEENTAVRVVIHNQGSLPQSFKMTDIHDVSSERSSAQGLGLGVVIVNELAKQMRMRVSYQSDNNRVSFEVVGPSHRGAYADVAASVDGD